MSWFKILLPLYGNMGDREAAVRNEILEHVAQVKGKNAPNVAVFSDEDDEGNSIVYVSPAAAGASKPILIKYEAEVCGVPQHSENFCFLGGDPRVWNDIKSSQ